MHAVLLKEFLEKLFCRTRIAYLYRIRSRSHSFLILLDNNSVVCLIIAARDVDVEVIKI